MNKIKTLHYSFFFPLAFFGFLLTGSSVEAQFDRGGDLGVGTRAMGMAGAFAAVADDSSASYWNPAGLAQMEKTEILGMYGSYFNDKNQNLYISLEYPLPNGVRLGLSSNNLFFPGIPGSHEDQYTGSLALALFSTPENCLFAGVNLRYLYGDSGQVNGVSQGWAADLGLLYRRSLGSDMSLRAGLVLTDISTTVTSEATGKEQDVPPVLTPGLALNFDPETLLALDLPWTLSNDTLLNNQNLRVRTGLEHWFFDGRLGFRAGYTSFITLPGDFSLGASYRAAQWSVDYAFMSNSSNLGNSHRLSVSWHFGSGEEILDPKPSIVRSLVGDGKIYLKWEIPEYTKADGYWVYWKEEGDKDYRRAGRTPFQTNYCLLDGVKNGVRYHLYVRSVVQGEEKSSSGDWVAEPKPMSKQARTYYEAGLDDLNRNNRGASLGKARKAEEMDRNNYEIQDLYQKLESPDHQGLVSEQGK